MAEPAKPTRLDDAIDAPPEDAIDAEPFPEAGFLLAELWR